MSKSLRVVAALAIAAVALSGCDFLRTLAGRPTSADLQALRAGAQASAVAAENSDTTVADAVSFIVDAAAEAAADSALRSDGVPLRIASELRNRLANVPVQRYYFIVGMFSQEDNALRVAAKADSAGYKYELLRYANGNTLVGVVPSATLSELYSEYDRLRQESFFPKESWVLENR